MHQVITVPAGLQPRYDVTPDNTVCLLNYQSLRTNVKLDGIVQEGLHTHSQLIIRLEMFVQREVIVLEAAEHPNSVLLELFLILPKTGTVHVFRARKDFWPV